MDEATRTGIRAAFRLALEHHPLCDEFRSDRIGRRVAFCSGCAVAFPALLAGFVAAGWALYQGAYPAALFATGAVLGLPQLTTYLHRGTRLWRAAVKALGGFGMAWFAVGGLLLPVPIAWRLVGAGLMMVAFAGMQALRLRAILRTCDACPFQRAWHVCPGFTPWQNVPRPAKTRQA